MPASRTAHAMHPLIRWALLWTGWLREDGSLHGPNGVTLPPVLSDAARSELVAAAEAGVGEVRRLKGEEGRGNKDELVLAAVAEMKRLRGVLLADDEVRAERMKLGI